MNISLKRNKEDAPAVRSTAGLQLLSGGFDFTEGAFSRAERTRRTFLTITVLSLILLTGAVLMGLTATVSAGSYNAQAEQAETKAAGDAALLAKLDTAGGFPASALEAHVNSRTSALKTATANEINSSRLITESLAAAPSGVTISAIAVVSGKDTSTATKAPTPPKGATPAPSPTATAAKPGGDVGTLKITGVATSFTDVTTYQTALLRIPGVQSVDIPPSGGSGQWTINAIAVLNDQALTPRAQAAQKTSSAATGGTP